MAQRPLDQNSKPITAVPAPLVTTSPVTVPQMNSRSVFSGSAVAIVGGLPIVGALAVPPGTRLWTALEPTDSPAVAFPFGDTPMSKLFIRLIKRFDGLVDIDLVNLDTVPHPVDWAVGYVAANLALVAGATP
jgi:hypothetical protein